MVGWPAAVARRPGVPPAQVDPAPGAFGAQDRGASSLKEGVSSGRLLREGGALRGSSQRDTDLHDGTQLRYLRMLKELRANAQVSTDSQKARPKAKSSHVPLHERARKGERVRKLPPRMNILQRVFCLVRLSRHYLPPVADYGEKKEGEVRKSRTLQKGVRRRAQSICIVHQGPQGMVDQLREGTLCTGRAAGRATGGSHTWDHALRWC